MANSKNYGLTLAVAIICALSIVLMLRFWSDLLRSAPVCPKCPECPTCPTCPGEPGGPSSTPSCGNCNLTLDPTASPPVRHMSMKDIPPMGGCIDPPEWRVQWIDVIGVGGASWSYEPQEPVLINDLSQVYEFDLKEADDPPIGAKIKDVVVHLVQTNANGATHNRGCVSLNSRKFGAACLAACQP